MAPADLTVKSLQEIRDELRESRDEQRAFRQSSDQRFEVIETTLRDLAEQMVTLGRGMKVLLEGRGDSDARFESLESRVSALEKKVS